MVFCSSVCGEVEMMIDLLGPHLAVFTQTALYTHPSLSNICNYVYLLYLLGRNDWIDSYTCVIVMLQKLYSISIFLSINSGITLYPGMRTFVFFWFRSLSMMETLSFWLLGHQTFLTVARLCSAFYLRKSFKPSTHYSYSVKPSTHYS